MLSNNVEGSSSRSSPVGSSPATGPAVEYRADRAAEIVERCKGRFDFYWAINPYAGCELGCVFCTVRQAAVSRGESWGSFSRQIRGKEDASRRLAEQLSRLRVGDAGPLQGRPVALGTTTDPWQPVEREHQITRSILTELSTLRGLDVRCNTRSSLVGRDADLLGAIDRKGHVQVGISIPTLDRRLAALLEPQAPSPDRRLMAIEILARARVPVGVVVNPVIPGLTDGPIQIRKLLERARAAGASYASAAPLRMLDGARERTIAGTLKAFPDEEAGYRRILARFRNVGEGEWAQFSERFEAAAAEVGLALHDQLDLESRAVGPSTASRQLSLF